MAAREPLGPSVLGDSRQGTPLARARHGHGRLRDLVECAEATQGDDVRRVQRQPAMRTAIACVVLFVTGGEWRPSRPPSELPMVADRGLDAPPVSAELTYRSQRSLLGWGNFDLSADPDYDEIHVQLLLGTPASRRHWDRCEELRLQIDGVTERVRTKYAGVPMRDGVFDAVTAELSILTVRAMAGATSVRADLCGEHVELDPSARARLVDFVRRFDTLGIYDGPSLPKPPRELGPEHEWADPAPCLELVDV